MKKHGAKVLSARKAKTLKGGEPLIHQSPHGYTPIDPVTGMAVGPGCPNIDP